MAGGEADIKYLVSEKWTLKKEQCPLPEKAFPQ